MLHWSCYLEVISYLLVKFKPIFSILIAILLLSLVPPTGLFSSTLSASVEPLWLLEGCSWWISSILKSWGSMTWWWMCGEEKTWVRMSLVSLDTKLFPILLKPWSFPANQGVEMKSGSFGEIIKWEFVVWRCQLEKVYRDIKVTLHCGQKGKKKIFFNK